MVATPATVALEAANVPFTLHTYTTRPGTTRPGTTRPGTTRPRDSAATYGEAVAAELGFDSTRVFKTLIAAVDGDAVVAIVPVSAQLSLKALAKAVGGKRATLADSAIAERLTGYLVGGISPLGQRRSLRTVADTSLTGHPSVLVNGGRRGLQIELAPGDLVELTAAELAAIAAT